MSIASHLPNPFLNHVAGNTWTVPPWHLPELHRDVLDCCRGLLGSVRAAGEPTGLLVRGESGSGKTQLIAQFRAEMAATKDVVVVHIPLQTFAGGMWRHVRVKLVHELLAEAPHGTSGLMRLLDNRFAVVPKPRGGGWSITDLIKGGSATPSIAELLDKSVPDHELTYGLRVALPKLYDEQSQKLARYWLRGDPLTDKDYAQLGLPAPPATDVQQEQEARATVLSICQLAGDRTILAICLDEVEGLQEGKVDTVGLKALATLATQLVSQACPRLVVTFIRPETLVNFQKSVDVSDLNKMAQHQTEILPVEHWAQVEQLYGNRVAAAPALAAASQVSAEFWPLGEPFLRKLFQENKSVLTPRLLVRACAVEFQSRQSGIAPGGGPDLSVKLLGLWERQRAKHLGKLAALHLDKLFGIGLPWLRETANLPFTRVEESDARLADVNLVFRPAAGGPAVGVSFCNQPPKTLWPRLDRIIRQWDAAKKQQLLGRLVLVRAAHEERSKAANDRFERLRAAGATPLYVDAEQLAEFAAFEELFSKSKSGTMTDFGKPLPVADYCDWAADHLSNSVKELADSVFGHATPPTKPAKKAAAAA